MMTSTYWADPPLVWLDVWTHVLDGLAEGKVDWYAVVTYEALVQYQDRVVQELVEVVKSGMKRHGIELGDEMSRQINENVAGILNSVDEDAQTTIHLNDQQTGRRRLHLRAEDKDYLSPSSRDTKLWKNCLGRSACGTTLRTLISEIMPSFGYVSEGSEELSEIPGKVTTKDAYGHVLFSSEGGAL
eukprot:CAMPEP_0183756986 /NCGR_PEP_ID=MMETSP0739-20130205/5427_1 /TAXON_ID=385413 /ORGANISM="Thalassiosira miniscula, Strain CCMP1093" /LENGTH=185 /DNA_ID=CAMNT_0025994313 /DNA_START=1 /DNA_END=555 /DNA_ORIENTATION=-